MGLERERRGLGLEWGRGHRAPVPYTLPSSLPSYFQEGEIKCAVYVRTPPIICHLSTSLLNHPATYLPTNLPIHRATRSVIRPSVHPTPRLSSGLPTPPLSLRPLFHPLLHHLPAHPAFNCLSVHPSFLPFHRLRKLRLGLVLSVSPTFDGHASVGCRQHGWPHSVPSMNCS